MRPPEMWARAWRPAVCDESPKRKGDQKQDRANFEKGTHAEPGDRQRVRVLISGKWLTAIYDRAMCCFWRRLTGKGWCQVTGEVLAWTQYPLSADFVDPEVVR